MPRAGHLFTCDRAFRQRPSSVGAGVVEGVDVAVDIEQGDPLAVDLDPSCLTGRDFFCLRYFQKLSHRLILQISGAYAQIPVLMLVLNVLPRVNILIGLDKPKPHVGKYDSG